MADVFIAAATRTPFGRYGGRLAAVRCDDLAAASIMSLMSRYPSVDWGAVDEVVLGCANQAGEDNRNVARMALLLSSLPETVPAVTVNRGIMITRPSLRHPRGKLRHNILSASLHIDYYH